MPVDHVHPPFFSDPQPAELRSLQLAITRAGADPSRLTVLSGTGEADRDRHDVTVAMRDGGRIRFRLELDRSDGSCTVTVTVFAPLEPSEEPHPADDGGFETYFGDSIAAAVTSLDLSD